MEGRITLPHPQGHDGLVEVQVGGVASRLLRWSSNDHKVGDLVRFETMLT